MNLIAKVRTKGDISKNFSKKSVFWEIVSIFSHFLETGSILC